MEACTPYLSDRPFALDERAPILIVSADTRSNRTDAVLADAGWRIARVPLTSFADRLAMQVDASCILIEADPLESVDWQVGIVEAIGDRPLPILLSGSIPSIDRMAAFSGLHEAEILVDPSPVDLALAVELASPRMGATAVHDIGGEPSAARLRQLSDEVGRIAATLARLSTGPSTAAAELPPPVSGLRGGQDVTGEQVRSVIRARRLRSQYFDPELFADPAWDMLLDLLQAEIAQHRVPVSSLCIAAAVPPTTALRWIKTMTDAGLFQRRADPHDGRRIFVELAPQASTALRRYFSDVGAVVAA